MFVKGRIVSYEKRIHYIGHASHGEKVYNIGTDSTSTQGWF